MSEHPADLVETVRTLQDTVVALAREVAALQLQLDKRPDGRFHSMRYARRCPACGGGRLLHVKQAKDSHGGGVQRAAISFEVSAWTGSKPRGPLELYACRTCGLVEYHVTDFSDIDIDGDNIVEIDTEAEPQAEGGPFR